MQILIKLISPLNIGRFKENTFEYPDGTTVQEIVDKHAIPRNEIGTILVNGSYVNFKTRLKDGDVLYVVPEISGG